MRTERVRYFLEKKDVDLQTLQSANLKKMTLEDQMIVRLIVEVLEEGNVTAWERLNDAAYGKLAPGKGPDRDESGENVFTANFQGIESKDKLPDRQIDLEDEIKERENEA